MTSPTTISGYRLLTSSEIELVNNMKEIEERVLRVTDSLRRTDVDQRWLAIGITHLQEGFMAVNRSITKPERIRLPDDPVVSESKPDAPSSTSLNATSEDG